MPTNFATNPTNCIHFNNQAYPFRIAGNLVMASWLDSRMSHQTLDTATKIIEFLFFGTVTALFWQTFTSRTMEGMMNRLILVVWVVLLGWNSVALGQGKLGSVRKNVKQNATRPAPRPSNDRDDEEDRRDRDDRRRRPSRNRSSRDCGSWGFLSFAPAPQPVVQHVHVHETVVQPLAVAQPVAPVPVVSPAPVVHAPLQLTEPNIDPGAQSVIVPSVPAPEISGVSPTISPAIPANPVTVGEPFFEEIQYDWASRFSVQAGSDFDGLFQGGFDWLIQDPGGLGLQTSATMFRESGVDFRDHLWIGDVNLMYEPISGRLRSRFGVGLNWLGDRFGGDAGFNLTAGMDFQLTKEVVFVGEVDFGTLGDSDFLNGLISLGYQVDHTEFYTGYRYLDIGGAELDGVVFGARFRF